MAGVCGRDCGNCGLRGEYGCGGCLETEGHPVWGECRVVRCCHGRGLRSCGECPSAENCGAALESGLRRERWPQEEAERRRLEEERQSALRAEMARRAPVLGRWLSVLFWMGLFSVATTLLDRLDLGYGIRLTTSVLDMLAGVLCLYCYWRFSGLSGRFRLIWRLGLGILVLNVVMVIVLLAGGLLGAVITGRQVAWSGLLGLVGLLAAAVLVMGLVLTYQFCGAMAEQLEGACPRLADKWSLLRKWLLGSLGTMGGCVVLAFLLPTLGLLLLLGAAAALAGCSVAELVLLWKSTRFFREEAECLAAAQD